MKIQNKKMNCKGWRKYYWYAYVQLGFLLWMAFKKKNQGLIFFENNEITNLFVKKSEIKRFWLPRYLFITLKLQGKLDELTDFYVQEIK